MDKKRIFVAEDDKGYGKIYKVRLEREGFEVSVIDQGDQVVSEVVKQHPDLLILDLMLPKKSGFEILEELRSKKETKDLKVIIASNLSQEIDKEKVEKLGVLDYFIKSDISIADLMAKVKGFVGDTV